MTTNDLVGMIIDAGIKAYKKNSKGSKEARKLDRHEEIEIDGYKFSYWREYATYKMAEYICDILPELEKGVDIIVVLDGNDSTIELTITDKQQEKLNRETFLFLQKQGLV